MPGGSTTRRVVDVPLSPSPPMMLSVEPLLISTLDDGPPRRSGFVTAVESHSLNAKTWAVVGGTVMVNMSEQPKTSTLNDVVVLSELARCSTRMGAVVPPAH